MQVGQIKKFNFAKGKEFKLKESLENVNLPLTWEWARGNCPHCAKKIIKSVNYTIDKINILEDQYGEIISIGYTKELVGEKPLTMRLPDKDFHKEKDMSVDIKSKSQYLKEKK